MAIKGGTVDANRGEPRSSSAAMHRLRRAATGAHNSAGCRNHTLKSIESGNGFSECGLGGHDVAGPLGGGPRSAAQTPVFIHFRGGEVRGAGWMSCCIPLLVNTRNQESLRNVARTQ